MKKMTKVLALVLALAMCLALCACGSQSSSDGAQTSVSGSTGVEDGVLTVGMECAYAPYNWTQMDDSVFFEDLTRWMEADSTKPLERIRPSVLQQMQKNGGIYRLPLTYTILTYAADPEQLSDSRPETVLQACEHGGEELYPFTFVTDYSSQMARRCAIDYVDAAQGTCNFECDSFYACASAAAEGGAGHAAEKP